jgi:hypothetical protein
VPCSGAWRGASMQPRPAAARVTRHRGGIRSPKINMRASGESVWTERGAGPDPIPAPVAPQSPEPPRLPLVRHRAIRCEDPLKPARSGQSNKRPECSLDARRTSVHPGLSLARRKLRSPCARALADLRTGRSGAATELNPRSLVPGDRKVAIAIARCPPARQEKQSSRRPPRAIACRRNQSRRGRRGCPAQARRWS